MDCLLPLVAVLSYVKSNTSHADFCAWIRQAAVPVFGLKERASPHVPSVWDIDQVNSIQSLKPKQLYVITTSTPISFFKLATALGTKKKSNKFYFFLKKEAQVKLM